MWIGIGIILGIITSVISMYNGLVSLRNRAKNAFAQIDVQLKRRYDLIPNLVETAKAFMKHEKDTLEAVINARNSAMSAQSKVHGDPTQETAMNSLMSAETQLSSALGRLFALSENYPELRSNQNMLNVQEELTSTENKVAFSRQAYNDAVTAYNTKCEVFPSVIVARLFAFQHSVLFEVENAEERAPVKVSF